MTSTAIDLPVLILMLTTLWLVKTSTKKSALLQIDNLALLACVVILMIPVLGLPPLHSIDRGISLCIAFAMVMIGLQMGQEQARILLCHSPFDERPLLKQVPRLVSLELT